MEPSIYSFSLCTALPLMLFFGFYFFFVCKDSRKRKFSRIISAPTDYGYSYVAAFSKLFGTFLLWYPIQKCGFCHIDEHVHILSVLFSVQFGIDNVAGSFLHYQTACVDTYHLWIIFSTLSGLCCSVAKRDHAKILFICFGCMVSRFGVVLARRVIIAYRRAIPDFQ